MVSYLLFFTHGIQVLQHQWKVAWSAIDSTLKNIYLITLRENILAAGMEK